MSAMIEIDEELMRGSLRTACLKTRREAVEPGLRVLLWLWRQAEVRPGDLTCWTTCSAANCSVLRRRGIAGEGKPF